MDVERTGGRDYGNEDIGQLFSAGAVPDQLRLRVRQRGLQLLPHDADAGDDDVALRVQTGARLSGRQRLLLLHRGIANPFPSSLVNLCISWHHRVILHLKKHPAKI